MKKEIVFKVIKTNEKTASLGNCCYSCTVIR